jgi:hypothetical protein
LPVAFGASGQVTPHDPQWVAVTFRSTHCEPHWLSVPLPQSFTHCPELQSGVALGHDDVHEPHVVPSVRSASHPFCALPSHEPLPILHVPTAHLPSSQMTLAANGTEHRAHDSAAQP